MSKILTNEAAFDATLFALLNNALLPYLQTLTLDNRDGVQTGTTGTYVIGTNVSINGDENERSAMVIRWQEQDVQS